MSELEKLSPDHLNVYRGFLTVTKWTVIVVALVLVGMAIFLT
ncbi:MAG: aa3-type cytochrome c oxidase subunit IV [Sandarakinorhabdus sp.]|nr:aa3-type cytochrome c oxidase subunit IV [Sandarakinorhabdus sp.]